MRSIDNARYDLSILGMSSNQVNEVYDLAYKYAITTPFSNTYVVCEVLYRAKYLLHKGYEPYDVVATIRAELGQ